ncbi:hypothetical protein J6590_009247 [Homalodisca vitripennis]|nr:hypothetical protein J6590_009247 [Homalodisca vitripennis]
MPVLACRVPSARARASRPQSLPPRPHRDLAMPRTSKSKYKATTASPSKWIWNKEPEIKHEIFLNRMLRPVRREDE